VSARGASATADPAATLSDKGRATQSANVEGAAIEPLATAEIHGLRKSFFRRDIEVHAIDDVSLTVAEGEFVVLLGPSGCGKTTLLRCIAGLEVPDSGTIDVCGKRVFSGVEKTHLPAHKRSLNMMFQSYALWPHMTVAQNVAFPLETRRTPKVEAKARVAEVLALTGIDNLADSHPAQLSGGQQQRVALARALVARDRLILFDEPLSNVDAKVREQLRVELVEMQHRLNFSAIYVTHDQVEAMELADRVIVLEHGRIAQDAPPAVVYDRPASRYVANFIGNANEVRGVVCEVSPGDVAVDTELGKLSCSADTALRVGDAVVVIWRPEFGTLVSASEAEVVHSWEAKVHASLFAGAHTTVVVEVNGLPMRIVTSGRDIPDVDSVVWVHVPKHHLSALPDNVTRP